MQRPDMSQMTSKLFSQLDTKNQGYIEQSDLETAFSSISSTDSSTSVEAIFNQLDADGNGKVTEQEMSASMKELTEQFESSFNASRTTGMGGGMPPPPPPGDREDEGLTQEQMTSMASEVSSTDSNLSSMLTTVAANFDAADTDSDGKVTFKEAMAYQQSQQTTASSSASTSTSTVTAAAESSDTSSTSTSQGEILHRMMQLMQAYGGFGQDSSQYGASAISSLIASA